MSLRKPPTCALLAISLATVPLACTPGAPNDTPESEVFGEDETASTSSETAGDGGVTPGVEAHFAWYSDAKGPDPVMAFDWRMESGLRASAEGTAFNLAAANSADFRWRASIPALVSGTYSCEAEATMELVFYTKVGSATWSSAEPMGTCTIEITELGAVGEPVLGRFSGVLVAGPSMLGETVRVTDGVIELVRDPDV
jgi:hypothetical protein